MFNFDRADIQRFAVSAMGALVVSTACITAAVGPARAAGPAPLTVDAWQQSVEQQIAETLRRPATMPNAAGGVATVRLSFDADGTFRNAALARSTGTRAFDMEAMRTADGIDYPVLPAGLRGSPQTVAMKIGFDAPVQQSAAARRTNATQVAAR